ncbi:MAG TPA: sigma-70 family RNA polymerase sigma factor [Candidatus Dormibacteraeota bacterium]|nr:sigma-70 family RNA polymerase sigma factor [Candidatus Dormibacteraeota bacterium]
MLAAVRLSRFPGGIGLRRRSIPAMQAHAEDSALADAFAAHERWAFDEAYARYASLLYSTAYHVVGNGEDAEDVVHDALARIWRSPGAYTRSRGAIRSFLVVCVRNEAVSRVRSKQRRLRLVERVAAEPEEHDELRVVDVIEHDRLRNAMTKLPPEQRRPLELAYFEQLSHTEIARTLDQPLGTVKSRIAMGLRKLGAALQPPS